jgi:peptidoglycan hydrolase CwlO-like protein
MKVSTSLTPGDQLPVLLERIERREKSARIRGVLYSLLPVTFIVILLGYAATSVRNAQNQIDALKTEASTYTSQIDALKNNAETYKTQAQSQQGNRRQLQKTR